MILENIKAIEVDLDGTIFLPDQQFSPQMVDTFKMIKEKGLVFVVNTGRGIKKGIDILKEADVLKYVDYVLGSNGIEIYDVKNDDLKVSTYFKPEVIDSLCVKYCAEKVSLCVYEGSNILADKITVAYVKRCAETNCKPASFNFKDYSKRYPKMIGIINPDDYDYFHELFEKDKDPRYEMHFSTKYLCEITPAGTSKYIGTKNLFESLKIDEESVVTFGDGENDINMMKGNKIKVAMGHAPDSLKEVCDYVTSDIYHDGVKEFLDKYVF